MEPPAGQATIVEPTSMSLPTPSPASPPRIPGSAPGPAVEPNARVCHVERITQRGQAGSCTGPVCCSCCGPCMLSSQSQASNFRLRIELQFRGLVFIL
jgi:hypothetical protein